MEKTKLPKQFGIWLIVICIFLIYMAITNQAKTMDYSQLVKNIDNSNVAELNITDKTATFRLKNSNTEYKSEIPSYDALVKDVKSKKIVDSIPTNIEHSKFSLSSIIGYIIPIIIIFVLFNLFASKGGPGSNFTHSPAKVEMGKGKVKFENVAGADEEKAELQEIVEFLSNPQKFVALGARIPKGILLVGPPGTGKTLLAKAVAGEAGAPFYSMSGSDFVELYVGVGASRVRDLFTQAKKTRPCIIFIDEIDAVGRKRGAGMGGGHDEREQTLNQLLVEMDGFGENEGIIIMAATNRPDILDHALLRPGRFDRQVVVNLPTINGREAILKLHSKKKPLSPEVNLNEIAKATSGYSGADLENLMNESAIIAARKEHVEITSQDIHDANLKVILGNEKRSQPMTENEKRLTAYHEAGHALLNRLLDNNSKVTQISIIPRGKAGGFTMQLPIEDRTYQTKKEMHAEIEGLLGGRAAEELMLDDISTGASSDLERATKLATELVSRYGMGDALGLVAYNDNEGEVFLGRDYAHSRQYSEATASTIDNEVRTIVNNAYRDALAHLKEHSTTLTAIAELLLEKETIDQKQFEECYLKSENI